MITYAIFDNTFFQQKPWWLPHKLYNVVCKRSNPRSQEYMVHLVQELFQNVKMVNIDNIPQEANKVIVLYSDPIGLGYGALEKRILKQIKNIQVVNGRKRCFNLTSSTRYKMLLLRFLEITFLPELICLPWVLALGVVLSIKDSFMGKN